MQWFSYCFITVVDSDAGSDFAFHDSHFLFSWEKASRVLSIDTR